VIRYDIAMSAAAPKPATPADSFGLRAVVSSCLALSIACGGTSDPSAAPPGSISQTCARIIECADAPGRAECEPELESKRSNAAERGCGALYDEFLRCDEQQPGACNSDLGYELTPHCAHTVDAIEGCIAGGDRPPEECLLSRGPCANPPCPTTCFIECADFGAECSGEPGEPMSCSCTKGAGAGRQFSSADCQSMNDEAAQSCR
jgi:hypothetical protein